MGDGKCWSFFSRQPGCPTRKPLRKALLSLIGKIPDNPVYPLLLAFFAGCGQKIVNGALVAFH